MTTKVFCPQCKQRKRLETEMTFVKSWETEQIDLDWNLKASKSYKATYDSYICPVCGKKRDVERV